MERERSRHFSLKNKSIRTQLIVYMGCFVVLPLCLALMFLNIYLQRVTTENMTSYDSTLLSQIKANGDQMIEVTNYSTSMMMTSKSVLENLHTMARSGDSYDLYRAKTELSARLSEMESSVLNAVGGKIAILTNSGYLIGAHNLSRTSVDYEGQDWYQQIVSNGRKTTFCTELQDFFAEMTTYPIREYRYLYIGRSVLDYSGEKLGVLLIQLSGTKIWGKFTQAMVPLDEGTFYIFDGSREMQMEYNGEKDRLVQLLIKEEPVWRKEADTIIQGVLKNGYKYMAVSMEHGGNTLVYAVPARVYLEGNLRISRNILGMVLLLIAATIITMIYFSRKLSRPLTNLVENLENSENGILKIQEPEQSFLEIHKFIASYNRAGLRIEELIEKVKTESHLKEKAHYEMLMSQISPHFIFNTVNSIRIMAREEQDVRTSRALESLGEILHGVYDNRNGMTTVGQETALLEAYVDIMKFRFGNSFQYYNVIPTDLYFYEIPAFTMQPIVENAILHGVKDVTAGQIIVSAVEYEHDFLISIFNNGNSADKDMVEEMLKSPHRNQRTFTGMGLYNVNSRLKMLYGDNYGLIFNEQVKAGFEIWIRIPKKTEFQAHSLAERKGYEE